MLVGLKVLVALYDIVHIHSSDLHTWRDKCGACGGYVGCILLMFVDHLHNLLLIASFTNAFFNPIPHIVWDPTACPVLSCVDGMTLMLKTTHHHDHVASDLLCRSERRGTSNFYRRPS